MLALVPTEPPPLQHPRNIVRPFSMPLAVVHNHIYLNNITTMLAITLDQVKTKDQQASVMGLGMGAEKVRLLLLEISTTLISHPSQLRK